MRPIMNFYESESIKNCILLPIETESQESTLQIFHTLNDKGMPLFDSDIFKS